MIILLLALLILFTIIFILMIFDGIFDGILDIKEILIGLCILLPFYIVCGLHLHSVYYQKPIITEKRVTVVNGIAVVEPLININAHLHRNFKDGDIIIEKKYTEEWYYGILSIPVTKYEVKDDE